MRWLIIGLVIAPMIGCGERVQAADPIDPGFCIIRPTEPASAEIYADHRGRRYYFCCESCRRDFLSDPTRFDGTAAAESAARIGPAKRLWQDPSPALFDTIWGRVGQVVLTMTSAAERIGAGLHLEDPVSLGLSLLSAAGLLVVAALWVRQWRRGEKLRPSVAAAGAAVLALMPCFYADRLRHQLAESRSAWKQSEAQRLHFEKQLQLAHDRDMVHHATLLNFGSPPIPRPSELPPSLRKTYYRGNDERSDEMPHGGNHRTVTFEIWIEDADGNFVEPGSRLVGPNQQAADLFLVVQFTRSAGTSSGYFTQDYMQRMYVTMESAEFLGRDAPVEDRVAWAPSEKGRVWTARYPLPAGRLVWETCEDRHEPRLVRRIDEQRPFSRGGIVYLCEDRYEGKRLLGGRYHYAIRYDLRVATSVVTPESDLWMDATYRGRNFAKLQIEDDQWLSSEPLPEKQADELAASSR